MKEVLFITAEDAGEGFRLTGVRQHRTGLKDARKVLNDAMADPNIGLIAIDERLVQGLGEEHVHALGAAWPGVLVTLPAPLVEGGEGLDSLQRLVRRALGYHVRLEP